MVTARKPVARTAPPAKVRRPAAPAATKAASAPARKAAPAKPATRTRTAPASRTEAQKAQVTAARATRTAKVTEAHEKAKSEVSVHPMRQEEVTAYDVLRARHTYEVLYSTWLKQQGEEITEVLDFVAPIMDARRGSPTLSPPQRAKVKPEERVIDEFYDRDVVDALNIKELRALAADLAAQGLITEKMKKSVILEQMEEAGLFREAGDSDASPDDEDEEEALAEDDSEDDEESDDEDDDSDEDESEDDDEYGEETYTRNELKAMTLKELQELAEVNEMKWKGLDKAALIDAMLANEEEPEDEGDEEEADEDEGEEEVLEIDPDELPNMDLSELLELAEQLEIDIPRAKRKNKDAVVNLILENLEEE